MKYQNKKIDTLQIRLTPNEKVIIHNYLQTKGIRNKSKWILNLINKEIKNDNNVGIFEYQHSKPIVNVKKQIELEILERN